MIRSSESWYGLSRDSLVDRRAPIPEPFRPDEVPTRGYLEDFARGGSSDSPTYFAFEGIS
ncbi:hypothetical protein K438DRAFT_519328 [Mycena galopus ATCC 62051]|nr:hypothetical protein K438DRAFT_519328 [Mycena galopus ATCC 62051]